MGEEIMAKQRNQKMKLVRLIDIMEKYTDEEHGLTMPEIIEKLAAFDISAERKSIYEDFELLRSYGFDIGSFHQNGYRYNLQSRDFDIAELKMLVDAVQSSKFITPKKTRLLVEKISHLASDYQANELQRTIRVANQLKSENEKILYTVDAIHNAINANRAITFNYLEWTPRGKKVARHGGELYHTSPWALIWDDEYYYLAAYEEKSGLIKHFRVDKMQNTTVTKEKRNGYKLFRENLKSEDYSRKFFGMYHGKEERVTLRCDNSIAGVIYDRFGKGVSVVPSDEGYFDVTVSINVSDIFFGWVTNFGSKMKITAPQNVVDDYKKHIKKIIKQYK